jgi:protein-tyrosine phosphatase
MTVTIINNELITSGLLSARKKDKLGIIGALSLCEADPKKTQGEIVIPLHNNMDNLPGRVLEILKVIDMELEMKHRPFLIHCEHGRDRSPTIAALFLYYSGKFHSFTAALRFVQSRNLKLKPKKEFVKFIEEEVVPLIHKRTNGRIETRSKASSKTKRKEAVKIEQFAVP